VPCGDGGGWFLGGPDQFLHRPGRGYWASLERLDLLTARQLLALVPPGVQTKLVRLRLLGLTHSLVLILKRP
jgi:hypothetical protein